MKITFSDVSDKGLKRPSNQDSIFSKVSEDNRIALFVIADGMGGHYMGELASGAITSGFSEWWTALSGCGFERTYEECVAEIRQVLKNANKYVYDNYTASGHTCGSTVVVLFIYGIRYYMINVGDSRLYEYKGKRLHQISFDHTYGSIAVRDGRITEAEISGNKKYGKLVEAIGCKKEYNYFELGTELCNNRFLLCTDGLYKAIPVKIIEKKIRSGKNLSNVSETLLKDVFAAGAKDNVSMIIIDIYDENYKPVKNKNFNIKKLILPAMCFLAFLILAAIIVLLKFLLN